MELFLVDQCEDNPLGSIMAKCFVRMLSTTLCVEEKDIPVYYEISVYDIFPF